jgi:hypothetical protein
MLEAKFSWKCNVISTRASFMLTEFEWTFAMKLTAILS